MLTVILGWAAILLWLAAPAIGAALLLAAGALGVGLVARGLASGGVGAVAMGAALIGLVGVAGWSGYRFLRGPPPALPVVEWLDAATPSPAPRVYAGTGWQTFSVGTGLLGEGRVDRVLRPSADRGREPDATVRETLWEELLLDPACARRRAAGERIDWWRCTRWSPLALTDGAPTEPFLRFATRPLPGAATEEQVWLGEGRARRLVARYRIEEPAARHPLTDWLLRRGDRAAVAAARRRCYREVVERLTAARAAP